MVDMNDAPAVAVADYLIEKWISGEIVTVRWNNVSLILCEVVNLWLYVFTSDNTHCYRLYSHTPTCLMRTLNGIDEHVDKFIVANLD